MKMTKSDAVTLTVGQGHSYTIQSKLSTRGTCIRNLAWTCGWTDGHRYDDNTLSINVHQVHYVNNYQGHSGELVPNVAEVVATSGTSSPECFRKPYLTELPVEVSSMHTKVSTYKIK